MKRVIATVMDDGKQSRANPTFSMNTIEVIFVENKNKKFIVLVGDAMRILSI